MSTDPLTEVTTASEIAEMFEVTPGAVRHAIIKGNLYAHRSGNVHLVRVEDALHYYKRQPSKWPERLKKWEKPE